MQQFITRVELHGATYEDYEELHEAMRKQGFSRTIPSDDGTLYHLPTAEYYVTGNFTCQQVIDAAKIAANSTGRTYSIITTQGGPIRWVGLEVVKK